jgi:hypothetical protein
MGLGELFASVSLDRTLASRCLFTCDLDMSAWCQQSLALSLARAIELPATNHLIKHASADRRNKLRSRFSKMRQ